MLQIKLWHGQMSWNEEPQCTQDVGWWQQEAGTTHLAKATENIHSIIVRNGNGLNIIFDKQTRSFDQVIEAANEKGPQHSVDKRFLQSLVKLHIQKLKGSFDLWLMMH